MTFFNLDFQALGAHLIIRTVFLPYGPVYHCFLTLSGIEVVRQDL